MGCSPSQENTTDTNKSTVCELCQRQFTDWWDKMLHYKRTHEHKYHGKHGFITCQEEGCNTCVNGGFFGDSLLVTTSNVVFKMTDDVTCKSRHVTYVVTCLKCKKQFIGATGGGSVEDAHGEHWREIKKGESEAAYVQHFLQCGVEKYSIMGVAERLEQKDPKARQSHSKEMDAVECKV